MITSIFNGTKKIVNKQVYLILQGYQNEENIIYKLDQNMLGSKIIESDWLLNARKLTN